MSWLLTATRELARANGILIPEDVRTTHRQGRERQVQGATTEIQLLQGDTRWGSGYRNKTCAKFLTGT